MFKRYRVSANINGRKAIDSKKSHTIEDAFSNFVEKLNKYKEKHEILDIKMCAGILMNEDTTTFSLARYLHPTLRELSAQNLSGIRVNVSDTGIL